jgi:hypothetical protein
VYEYSTGTVCSAAACTVPGMVVPVVPVQVYSTVGFRRWERSELVKAVSDDMSES